MSSKKSRGSAYLGIFFEGIRTPFQMKDLVHYRRWSAGLLSHTYSDFVRTNRADLVKSLVHPSMPHGKRRGWAVTVGFSVRAEACPEHVEGYRTMNGTLGV
jgi:hypothetical protein